MSINTMTTEGVKSLAQHVPDFAKDEVLKEQNNQRSVANTLAVLIKYIPTEVITLYIAAIATLETSQMRPEAFY